jgi:hypothetical protein
VPDSIGRRSLPFVGGRSGADLSGQIGNGKGPSLPLLPHLPYSEAAHFPYPHLAATFLILASASCKFSNEFA